VGSTGIGDSGPGEQGAGDKPAWRGLKRPGKAAGKPSRVGAAGRRTQRVARDGVTAARKEARETAERAADAARRAKEAAMPRLSHATDGVRRRAAANSETVEQVTLALLKAVSIAAGTAGAVAGKNAHKAPHPALKAAGWGIGVVGPVVATHAAKQVRKRIEKGFPEGPENAPDLTESVKPARPAEQAADVPSPRSGATEPSELADILGVRKPPDPEALYQDGSVVLELLFPLPEGLDSLPWNSLSHRNRFFVLVAAWALREADGIAMLKAGQPGQAREAFEECLIRARHMRTPELIARSYEDLGEVAAATGDEAAAQAWRAEAGRAIPG